MRNVKNSWRFRIGTFISSVAFLMNVHQGVFAQFMVQETPVDSRSIAMGESFVALRSNTAALMFNPAGLAGIHGARLSFSQRQQEWSAWTKGHMYNSFTGIIEIPFATVGVSYNRLDLGEFIRTSSSGPEGTTIKQYEHSFCLGAAHSFPNGVGVGICVKTFDMVEFPTTEGFPLNTVMSIMFDVGSVYSTPLAPPQSGLSDEFSVGVSLQNFGSNFKLKTPTTEEAISSEQLPRHLRAGFAYSLTFAGHDANALTPLKTVVTAEYRRVLNDTWQSASHQRDFYGFGVEAVFFEVLSGRIGGSLANIDWILSAPRKVALRYGAGISVPFARLGVSIPLVVSVDYAAIPLNTGLRIGSFIPVTRTRFDVFSIQIAYDADLF